MVIRKSDVESSLTQKQQAQLAALELQIDKKIAEEWSGHGYVCFDLPSGVHQRVIDALRAKYTEAGWDVEYEFYQREGAFLRFK